MQEEPERALHLLRSSRSRLPARSARSTRSIGPHSPRLAVKNGFEVRSVHEPSLERIIKNQREAPKIKNAQPAKKPGPAL